jgi:hypothetical protein
VEILPCPSIARSKSTRDFRIIRPATSVRNSSYYSYFTSFPLTSLETRHLIYTHLLSTPASTPIRGPHPRQLQTQVALSQSFSSAILRVNRQVYGEALFIFYGSKTQCVHITINYNVWSHKVQQSDFLLSGQVTAAMRHFHINIHLSNEKKTNRPEKEDSEARLAVVGKGARKLAKLLGGTEVKTLKIG